MSRYDWSHKYGLSRLNPACTFGNFSASIGKPKGKKTLNVSAMTSFAILKYRGNTPPNQNGILYFDTERVPIMFSVFSRHRLSDSQGQSGNQAENQVSCLAQVFG